MDTSMHARRPARLGRLALLGVALAGVVALAGCKSLGLDGQPDEMQVDVDAVGASEIVVVTSTDFSFIQDPNCEAGQQCDQSLVVLSADTVTEAIPFHRTYSFTSSRKYLVEVFPTGGVQATLSMRVRIDGKDWYDDARELAPAGADREQETLLFTYSFAKPGAT